MNRSLILLQMRRALHPGLALTLLIAALLVILARSARVEGASELELDAQAMRGFLRADLLIVLLLILVPVSIAQVASAAGRMGREEGGWLLCRSITRRSISLSSWVGSSVAIAIWLVALGVLCELAAGDSESTLQRGRSLEMTSIARLGTEGDLVWKCDTGPFPEGSVVRFSLGLFGDYNEVEELVLSSHLQPTSEPFASSSAQAGLRSILEVAVPTTSEGTWFQFRAKGVEESLMLHDTHLELWTPARESSGTWLFLLQVGLATASAFALALGLGCWLSPGSLLLFILGGYSLLWLEADRLQDSFLRRWLPGFDLPEALGQVALGRVPSALPLERWLGAALLTVFGMLVFHATLGRWRSGP